MESLLKQSKLNYQLIEKNVYRLGKVIHCVSDEFQMKRCRPWCCTE